MNPSAKMFRELFGQDRTLTIHKSVLKLVNGNHAAALLLSQIVYWSGKETDKDGWFPKSYEDWENELYLSKYQVGKAIKILKPLGVETKVKKSRYHGMTPTLHYRVNDKKLSETLDAMFTMESEETLQPESEKTSLSISIDDSIDDKEKDSTSDKPDEQTAPKDSVVQEIRTPEKPGPTPPPDESKPLTEHQKISGIVRDIFRFDDNYGKIGKYLKFLNGTIQPGKNDDEDGFYHNQINPGLSNTEIIEFGEYMSQNHPDTILAKPNTIERYVSYFRAGTNLSDSEPTSPAHVIYEPPPKLDGKYAAMVQKLNTGLDEILSVTPPEEQDR